MDKKEIKNRVMSAVKEYLANEEAMGDNVSLAVVPGSLEISLCVDADENDETKDYYDVMEFVEMNAEGKWLPDAEAIDCLADELAES